MPDYPDDDSLFVRVEGYKVILQDLEAVRQILENMKEAIHVLNQVESVKEQSIETFLENVDRLNDKLDSVEGEMPRLKDLEGGGSVTITADQQEVQQARQQQAQQQPGGQQTPQQEPAGQQPQPDDGREAVDDSIRELHDELKGLKDELNEL